MTIPPTPNQAEPADTDSGLTAQDRQFLRERAKMFSARRENAIGWIDETLIALKQLKKVDK